MENLTISPQLLVTSFDHPIEKVREIFNSEGYINKPCGGLWTSSFNQKTSDSAWVRWCLSGVNSKSPFLGGFRGQVRNSCQYSELFISLRPPYQTIA
jgi:hypothetical protein